jgi:hypothetical protein
MHIARHPIVCYLADWTSCGLGAKVRYPDGGAERTIEFENKDSLDNTTVAWLLKHIAKEEMFGGACHCTD